MLSRIHDEPENVSFETWDGIADDIARLIQIGTLHDSYSYPWLPAHGRATRAEVRARASLARRDRRRRAGGRGRAAARAPLGAAARRGPGPRDRGRLRVLRPGGQPHPAVRLRTRALRLH